MVGLGAATTPEAGAPCPFCAPAHQLPTLVEEGRDFFIIADHAPFAEGHLLLVPRVHYPCLALVPAELDAEFAALKARIAAFVRETYGAVTFWENGIFGQSVPHAHLHAFPHRWDPDLYRREGLAFSDLSGLRACYARRPGPYFTLEQDGEGCFLPPDRDLYFRIVRYARESFGGAWLLRRDERRLRGAPLVEAVRQRWARWRSATSAASPV